MVTAAFEFTDIFLIKREIFHGLGHGVLYSAFGWVGEKDINAERFRLPPEGPSVK